MSWAGGVICVRVFKRMNNHTLVDGRLLVSRVTILFTGFKSPLVLSVGKFTRKPMCIFRVGNVRITLIAFILCFISSKHCTFAVPCTTNAAGSCTGCPFLYYEQTTTCHGCVITGQSCNPNDEIDGCDVTEEWGSYCTSAFRCVRDSQTFTHCGRYTCDAMIRINECGDGKYFSRCTEADYDFECSTCATCDNGGTRVGCRGSSPGFCTQPPPPPVQVSNTHEHDLLGSL